jgi:hypothetical protein
LNFLKLIFRKIESSPKDEARRIAANIAKLSKRLIRRRPPLWLRIQDNEHVQKLIAARAREVTHRRGIAEAWAEKHDRGDTENIRESFIKIQDVIEAVERAIWHERYIADPKSEPFSPFGFRG